MAYSSTSGKMADSCVHCTAIVRCKRRILGRSTISLLSVIFALQGENDTQRTEHHRQAQVLQLSLMKLADHRLTRPTRSPIIRRSAMSSPGFNADARAGGRSLIESETDNEVWRIGLAVQVGYPVRRRDSADCQVGLQGDRADRVGS